jgi:hypothetical protein
METQRKLRVSVCSEDGKPATRIVGLQFALEENKRLVAKYSVQELAQSEILAVGIAIPRMADQGDEFLRSCEAALRSTLPQKRSQDQWAILKYSGGGEDGAVVKFSADAHTLAEALAAPGSKDAAALSLTDAAQRLFAEIAPKKAQRHVLLIGPSALSQPDADNLLELAKAGKIQVYSLVVAELDSDVNPHLRALCEASGGRIARAGAIAEIPRALEVLFCTLPSSYEITYVSNAATPTSRLSLQVYAPQGCGEQSCEMTGSGPAPFRKN